MGINTEIQHLILEIIQLRTKCRCSLQETLEWLKEC